MRRTAPLILLGFILLAGIRAKPAEPVAPCMVTLPRIFFQLRSSIPWRDTAWYRAMDDVDGPNEACEIVVQMLEDNPTMVLEIRGHVDSSEVDLPTLSRTRALVVKEMLYEKGIAPGRMTLTGFGAKNPIITEVVIDGFKTLEEQDYARHTNCRVEFAVASWDHKP
jgi:hypothetical protein